VNRAYLKRLEALESMTLALDGFKAILRTEWNRLLMIHDSEENVMQALGVRVVAVIDEDPPGADEMAVLAVEALEMAIQRPGNSGG
jgi:hypothetical protein